MDEKKNLLSKALTPLNATLNLVRSIGPFLISQTDASSTAYARHQWRLANVEAAKAFLVDEMKSCAAYRDALRKKLIDATPEESIRIRHDLKNLEGDIREFKAVTQAIELLPEFTAEQDANNDDGSATPGDDEQPTISAHWSDKFSQLIRARNEDWREDLLTRALAAEAANPGVVSVRALWLMGTLEQEKFEAFAALLDVASWGVGPEVAGFILPGRAAVGRRIPDCELGQDIPIGGITFMLKDTELVADFSSVWLVEAGRRLSIRYGNHSFTIGRSKHDLDIKGLFLTSIGDSIARFYKRRPNPFGEVILRDWVASLLGTDLVIIKHYDGLGEIACSGDGPSINRN